MAATVLKAVYVAAAPRSYAAAQLDHGGEFTALLEGGPDGGGGRLADDEHADALIVLREMHHVVGTCPSR